MGIETLTSSRLAEPIGWALAHSLWQGAAVGLVLAVVLLALRHRSPNARYVCAYLALLLMVALPFVTFLAPSSQATGQLAAAEQPSGLAGVSPLPSPGATELAGAAREAHQRTVLGGLDTTPPARSPARLNLRARLEPALPWAALVWFIGTVVLSIRLAGGYAVTQWMRRAGVQPAREACLRALERASARLRVSRPVELLESGLAQVPTVIGWLRPVILLPASVLSGLTPAQLEAVLAHELAHIRRHDYFANLLQNMVEVLLFYHPVMWWVSARVRAEREHCCDDIALSACGDRVGYAKALTALEVLRLPTPQPAVGATGGRLLSRIRRIVTPGPVTDRAGSWIAGIAALSVPTVLLSVLLLAPRPAVSQRGGEGMMTREGVTLEYEEGLDEARVEAIADIVSVAKTTIDELLPDNALNEVYVEVRDATDEYWESVVTDRIGAIYVGLGPKGIGEVFRADACPVGMLCQAVAELHNPYRYPGLDRFLTHRFLAAAILQELGPTPLPRAKLAMGADDPTGGLAMMSDPGIAAVHPDFAAAAAFIDIERELGWDRLRELLDEAPNAAQDPWRGLRGVVAREQPGLEAAFALHDQASTFEIDEDGTILVTSFEAEENVEVGGICRIATVDWLPVVASYGCETTFTDEWATDGDVSLRLDAPAKGGTIGFRLPDPDWRYKDWSLFEKFEMDIRFEGQTRTNIYAYVVDDPASGHSSTFLAAVWLEPGDVQHLSVDLTEETLSNGRLREGRYYDGAVRYHEIAMLQVTASKGEAPFSLSVDNIRLTPRPNAGAKLPGDDGAP